MKKVYICLLFIFTIHIFLYGEKVLTNDYSIINGSIDAVNNQYIYVTSNNNKWFIKIADIEKCCFNSYFIDNQRILSILTNNNQNITGIPVCISQFAVVIESFISHELQTIQFTSIKSVQMNIQNITNEYKEYLVNTPSFIEKTLKFVSDEYPESYFNEDLSSLTVDDFYDRFWEIMSLKISEEKKKIIWDLIQVYFKKEKEVNLLLSESNILPAIIKVRSAFVKRAYSIFVQ